MIDSNTIRLFRDILKGVGRNPKEDGKKNEGLAYANYPITANGNPENSTDQEGVFSGSSYQIARGSPKDTMQLNLVFEEETEGDHFEI